jgi:hypothetical protein
MIKRQAILMAPPAIVCSDKPLLFSNSAAKCI